jgi:alpha-beta hydrolase superfamily lysophospholipase
VTPDATPNASGAAQATAFPAAPSTPPEALYFSGGTARAFGVLHAGAMPTRAAGVVICPPIGHEYMFSHGAMRALAVRLAALGFPVLRLDYDGQGDAPGSDADAGRVRAWIDSIHAAVATLSAKTGVAEVALVGTRLGATLAALAAAEQPVASLVVWAPPVRGSAYMRELKAFFTFSVEQGEYEMRPGGRAEADEESGGFLYTAETAEAVKAIDLAKLAARPAPDVLVIGRDDTRPEEKLVPVLEKLGARVEYRPIAGLVPMIDTPHKSVTPTEVWDAIVSWLDARHPTRGGRAATTPGLGPTAAQVTLAPRAGGGQVIEEPLWIGDPRDADTRIFGILCRPASPRRAAPTVLFLNTARCHRAGQSRMYTAMARAWAERGVPSFRFDLPHIGDSGRGETFTKELVYADRSAEVRRVTRALADRGLGRFVALGLCSGAYHALHGGAADPAIVGEVLINLQTFQWKPGDSLEVNRLTRTEEARYYQGRAFQADAWKKLLSGKVDIAHVARVVSERAVGKARATALKLWARSPLAARKLGAMEPLFADKVAAGGRFLIVYCERDPGLETLHEGLGAGLKRLQASGKLTLTLIDGPDHNFTPLWSQVRLAEVVGEVLEDGAW